MIDSLYVVGAIVAMGLVTFALRATPFMGAQWLERSPLAKRLGEFLPLAIMTLLTVHSMVGNALDDKRGPWPELLSIAIVVILQWRKRNALLSILVGTAIYVLLRNLALDGF